MDAARRLVTTTSEFLDSLDDSQRRQANLPFDEQARRTWAYTPGPRGGVPMWALTRTQTKKAFKVLAAMLAPPAFARAVAVMSLEEVLDEVEGGRSGRRHIADYWLAVFGKPGPQPWGLRFEGHHVSVNATVAAEQVTLTPLFLGANPAGVRDGGHTAIAPLLLEEQLGFDAVHALTVEQRSAALLSDDAPDDIVTTNRPRLNGSLDELGVPVSVLDGAAESAVQELIRLYLDRFPPGVTRPPADDVQFGWAGALEPGIGHYYRLAGPRFLVELDNTQNGANHVHTVVRSPQADFGEDVLAAHYGSEHSS